MEPQAPRVPSRGIPAGLAHSPATVGKHELNSKEGTSTGTAAALARNGKEGLTVFFTELLGHGAGEGARGPSETSPN
jgi:hypothetical protein